MTEQNQNPNPNHPQPPALFQAPGGLVGGAGEAAAVARAVQEIQAALIIAKRFPRDEIRAIDKITKACQRKELAAEAEYEYSRGGTRITGPTVDLLRAVANRWGNIDYGWAEVSRRRGDPCGESDVRCYAWDMEANTKAERTFTVRHWRDTQSGGYGLDDERDIYELLANMAARRVRACLEEVIDADIVTMAVDICRTTLKTGEKTPIRDRAARMVTEFSEKFGVTREMIEARLGNSLDAVSENQMASLRRIYKSLLDGVGKREDYFKPTAAKPEFPPEPPQGAQGVSTGAPPPLASATPAPEPKPPTQNAPAPEPPTPAVSQPETAKGFNPVKAVRGLCKMGNVNEGWVLDYLAVRGATDGSCTSLEEVQIQNPTLLCMVADTWPDIEQQIKAEIAKSEKAEAARSKKS